MLPNIIEHFKVLKDPRREHPNKLHKLIDIIVITVWGVMANLEHWEEIAEYARGKEMLLRQYLDLPNGVPSHDTLNRTFALIDASLWESLFGSWMEQQGAESQAKIRAIQLDGKSLNGSRSSGTGKTEGLQQALEIVSVWAGQERMVLQQTAVAEGSNEIKAARVVLAEMDLANTVVSMDAIHAQIETMALIRKNQGDYLVALKKNQRQLFRAAQDLFEDQDLATLEMSQTFDVGHGRQEQRTLYVLRDLERLKLADARFEKWVDLNRIFVLDKQVLRQAKPSSERRFYLSSLICNASEALPLVRGHWSIENQQHYLLDLTFHEDANRTRKGFAARNLALVRRLVLNLLAQHLLSAPKKLSARRLRVRAAWDDSFVPLLLGLQVSH